MPPVIYLLTIPGDVEGEGAGGGVSVAVLLCASVAICILYCFFLIAPYFGAWGRLYFMSLAFHGYLHIFTYIVITPP